MPYLTATHERPPRHVTTAAGSIIPTQVLIDRQDNEALALAGIYPHVTAGGSAPLGYTDWTLVDGQYVRGPAGTQEERDAAALQQQREGMTLTRLQARLLLLQTPDPSGVFGSAWEAVMAWAQTQDAQTQAFWEDAQTWQRLNPYVLAGATDFGWDDVTLDQLFTAGAQL